MGFRWGMELFADFKIEMSALTMWANAITKGVWVWPVTALVASSSILLALRPRFGWWLSLLSCLFCNSVVAGFAFAIVALFNGLSGGDDGLAGGFPFQFSGIGAGVVLLMASFSLVQVAFFALVLGRRRLGG